MSSRILLKAGLVAAALAAGAAPAMGQEGDLVTRLAQGVRCSAASAPEDFGFNLNKLRDVPDAELGAAFSAIAADQSRCAPVRDAAVALAANYIVTPVVTPEEEIQANARNVVAQSLAAAANRAAHLKFEVGPPPRNMTKGRETGR